MSALGQYSDLRLVLSFLSPPRRSDGSTVRRRADGQPVDTLLPPDTRKDTNTRKTTNATKLTAACVQSPALRLREQRKPNGSRGRCGLWHSGHLVRHCHCTILQQVQMQKVQKMLQEKRAVIERQSAHQGRSEDGISFHNQQHCG
ncbi:Hypothetical protein SMAX5B_013391 [Scophthalmus maximus]|uniref:Uncharacterized protein n=1 Tax=Scophthalmus maximus TaxID=52904 RepID=A0A2U9B4Y2_SCOMX|nr:Hypothetical protein SMAX5B_013391 [Scophthalmus maximus]KAF0030433.1 hypothetical protein F2P81_017164 [Scophthalmus maximus]